MALGRPPIMEGEAVTLLASSDLAMRFTMAYDIVEVINRIGEERTVMMIG